MELRRYTLGVENTARSVLIAQKVSLKERFDGII